MRRNIELRCTSGRYVPRIKKECPYVVLYGRSILDQAKQNRAANPDRLSCFHCPVCGCGYSIVITEL